MRSAPLLVLTLWLLSPSALLAQDEGAASDGADDEPGERRAEREPRSVASPWLVEGVQPHRLALSFGAGWPAVSLGVSFAASDTLTTDLTVGYLYGAPHGGVRLAEGASIALGSRLRLWRRGAFELSLAAAAGVVIATDRRMALVSEEVINAEVRPLGTQLELDVTLSWRVLSALAIKLGLAIPAVFLLDMADRPDDDAWELSVPFAVRVGGAFRITDWLTAYATFDLGPVLLVEPVALGPDGLEQEVGVDFFLRASAGLAITPWR